MSRNFRQAVWDEPLIVELSAHGRRGDSVHLTENSDISKVIESIPASLRREKVPLPSVSEPQVIRHFNHLSQMNYGVDSGTFPLGSCSMKYNPKSCQRIASSSKLTRLHPLQPEESVQGILELLYKLSEDLCEVTGMDRFTLSPAAGAHGEYVGALIMRTKIREDGELGKRNEMLVPDSAHGTNPASAAMAGFEVVKIPSDDEGLVNVEAVKSTISGRTAGMMLTVPNTLGLFEKNIVEISRMVHESGGLMYYDGANMNALLGRVRPGDMDFDIIHLNLHKTFSTPHGGGGPGSGPVGVKAHLANYLPVPVIDKENERYFLRYDIPKTIGRVKSFHGNIGLLVRAYVYLKLLGRDGLKDVSGYAVLASNYLLSKLDKKGYGVPFSTKSPRKHEFVVSTSRLRKETGVSATDVAKALLDKGVHAPTIYFPLIVEEALMIEPTETEPIENLERYAEAMNSIATEATIDPEAVKNSPRNTSVGRLDEVKASHPLTLKLNWRKQSHD